MRSRAVTSVFDDLLKRLRACLDSVDEPRVRAIAGTIDWNMPARDLPAKPLPCLAHLDRIGEIAPGDGGALAALLAERRDSFHWGQTYTTSEFGQRFLDNYGWLEIFGTRGHFANDAVAAGVLVLGPGIAYPDHHHIAEELYIPLTDGTEWRMGDGPFRFRAAGEVVHHASNVSHAMRTGSEPLLALYVWRGGPLAQKSTIGRGA